MKMRTTLTLDDDVAAKLQELARARKTSFKSVVNEMLRLGLCAAEAPAPEDRFVVRAQPLHKRPGVQLDNIAELLEQIEGPGHK